jgi:DNA-binding Xre family transcriptional regulator
VEPLESREGRLVSATKKWETRDYQHMVSVERRDEQVLVLFKDGSRVAVDAARLLPTEARGADWSAMTFTPYEITVPTADEDVEIPWSTIRALTDRDYSAHVAAAAAEQARTVGNRLRELREGRGLTGKEVAERAGITPQSLTRIEHGQHGVVFTTLQRILATMGCSLKDLVVRQPAAGAGPTVRAKRQASAAARRARG